MTANELLLRGVHKSYGNVHAVRGIDLTVKEREFLTLLGPSGCGKTTLLRCVAGLESIDAGEISLGERVLESVRQGRFTRPEHRRFGMVFQSYALWPHMTVIQNVAYPLRMRKVPRTTAADTARRVLALVEMEHLSERPVSKLSGGQQQRAALARAMVASPDVMLFDEPLSNLDAALRESLRDYILEAHRETGGLSIYVTHDQSEAFYLSDRVAVVFDGAIRQIGTPVDLYRYPTDSRVARFIGFDNLIPGRLEERRSSRECWVRLSETFGGARIAATMPEELRVGDEVAVAFRSATLHLAHMDGKQGIESWGGRLERVEHHQGIAHCSLVFESGEAVKALVPPKEYEALRASRGDVLELSLDSKDAIAVAESPGPGKSRRAADKDAAPTGRERRV